MEEVLNFKRKKRQTDGAKKILKNMSREALLATFEKKKACNDRAMRIVERLIEPSVPEEWMLDNLKYISQCHFQDVVEERSIVMCCGYPLCDQTLSNIPSQQYHISTKYNKVFDITERKKYCSNVCFKAGIYLKEQLMTSPLWLRDFDELLVFDLYTSSNKSGQSGTEVDLGNPIPVQLETQLPAAQTPPPEEPDQERDHSSDEEDNTNYTEIEQRILYALNVNDEGTPNEMPEKTENIDGPPPPPSMPSISEEDEEKEKVQKVPESPSIKEKVITRDVKQIVPKSSTSTESSYVQNTKHETPVPPFKCSTEDKENSPAKSEDKKATHSKLNKEVPESTASTVSSDTKNTNLETPDVPPSKCSSEDKENTSAVKNMKSEDKKETHSMLNKEVQVPPKKSEKTERKIVTKKVKKPSMHDVVIKIEQTVRSWFTFDTLRFILGDERLKEMLIEGGAPTDVKAMSQMDPRIYERYSDICKKLNILEIKENCEDRDILMPSKPLPDYEELKKQTEEIEIKVKSFFKGDTKVSFKDDKKDEVKDDGEYRVLPTVDHHAIKATRRKIMLDKINKTLPDIQSALGLSSFHIAPEVKEFIFTLNLTANNILLKPSQWVLTSIILIKLLSVRDERLNFAFSSTTAQKYVALILMSYELDMGYLDRLLAWLINYEYLITDKRES